jgi:hypothetical protein
MNSLSAQIQPMAATHRTLIASWWLSRRRRRFEKILAETSAVADADRIAIVRAHLLRHEFDLDHSARLLAMIHRHWNPGLPLNVDAAWAAFLMLNGYGVADLRVQPREVAFLLAVTGAALAAVPVCWLVADELHASALLSRYVSFWATLNLSAALIGQEIESASIFIGTPPLVAQAYLQQRHASNHLAALIDRIDYRVPNIMPPLSLVLVEAMDIWLQEKAFAVVKKQRSSVTTLAWRNEESSQSRLEQITLHDVFRRFTRRGGSLLGEPDFSLWRGYRVMTTHLGKQPGMRPLDVHIHADEAGKRQALSRRLQREPGENICVLATTTESCEMFESLCNELKLKYSVCDKLNLESIQKAFMTSALVLVRDKFPWFDLQGCAENFTCQWLILDIHISVRLLYHLSHFDHTLRLSLYLGAQDAVLKEISFDLPTDLYGQAAFSFLLKRLYKIDRKRGKMHSEMRHWMAQVEKL